MKRLAQQEYLPCKDNSSMFINSEIQTSTLILKSVYTLKRFLLKYSTANVIQLHHIGSYIHTEMCHVNCVMSKTKTSSNIKGTRLFLIGSNSILWMKFQFDFIFLNILHTGGHFYILKLANSSRKTKK